MNAYINYVHYEHISYSEDDHDYSKGLLNVRIREHTQYSIEVCMLEISFVSLSVREIISYP